MTDEIRVPDPLAAVQSLPRGCAVILRHTVTADRRIQAHRLKPLCRRQGLKLIIAGDPFVAEEVGADGLHLPEAALRSPSLAQRSWRQRHPDKVLTAAIHSSRSLYFAGMLGVDAVTCSPVFVTDSHPDGVSFGIRRFSAICRETHIPVIALGGLTEQTVTRLLGSGCAGIAAIGGLL